MQVKTKSPRLAIFILTNKFFFCKPGSSLDFFPHWGFTFLWATLILQSWGQVTKANYWPSLSTPQKIPLGTSMGPLHLFPTKEVCKVIRFSFSETIIQIRGSWESSTAQLTSWDISTAQLTNWEISTAQLTNLQCESFSIKIRSNAHMSNSRGLTSCSPHCASFLL